MLKVIWNQTEIGTITDLSRDMWYLEGQWHSNETEASKVFEEKLIGYDLMQMLKDPQTVLKVILMPEERDDLYYCLVTGLENGHLSLREVTGEKSLDIFFPER